MFLVDADRICSQGWLVTYLEVSKYVSPDRVWILSVYGTISIDPNSIKVLANLIVEKVVLVTERLDHETR